MDEHCLEFVEYRGIELEGWRIVLLLEEVVLDKGVFSGFGDSLERLDVLYLVLVGLCIRVLWFVLLY